MALALSTQVCNHKLRTKEIYISAQASGSYTPGGDPINLNNVKQTLGQSADDGIGYPGNIKDYSVVSAPPGFTANLVKGSNLTNWGLQVFQTAAASPDGVPLGLGTLSAAGTNSTYLNTGLFTVATTTPPPLGAFIVLSNGATAKGIFMNGVMVQVTAVVPGVSYSFQFGQGLALAFASAADTLKWQQVQVSAGNVVQAQQLAAPVTGVLATASLLTVTQANSLQAGQFVYLGGTFKAASYYASGAIVQVASASATGWTANWQGTIIAQTSSEVATSSLLVTNGNAPVSAYPQTTAPTALITNSLAVAAAANATGLFTLTALQNFQAGMLIVTQGLGVNTTANGSIATVISTGLTQALIKANGWTVIQNTQAETAGYSSVLVSGAPVSPTGELPAAPYPASALAAPFVFMVEGPKGQL
jgi:hypothetical protein